MNLNCPNCHTQLTRIQLDKIEVDHCNNCGGTLFDYNEINRISLSDAEKLSLMKQTHDISGDAKVSPRDGSELKRIEDESVPQYVTLLKSDTTQEVFAYPDDLVNFKKAQNSKLSYMKAWHIPLPALSSVMVLSFVIAISAGTVLFSSLLTQPQSQGIQASDLCRNGIEVFRAEDGGGTDGEGTTRNQADGGNNGGNNGTTGAYGVTCQTESDMTCRVSAQCLGKTENYVLTNTRTRIHAGLIPSTCSRIKMICSDNGLTVETEEQPLE